MQPDSKRKDIYLAVPCAGLVFFGAARLATLRTRARIPTALGCRPEPSLANLRFEPRNQLRLACRYCFALDLTALIDGDFDPHGAICDAFQH